MNSLLICEVMSQAEQETAKSRTVDFSVILCAKSSICLKPSATLTSAEGASQAPDTSSIMNEEFWSRAGSDLPEDYLRFSAVHVESHPYYPLEALARTVSYHITAKC